MAIHLAPWYKEANAGLFFLRATVCFKFPRTLYNASQIRNNYMPTIKRTSHPRINGIIRRDIQTDTGWVARKSFPIKLFWIWSATRSFVSLAAGKRDILYIYIFKIPMIISTSIQSSVRFPWLSYVCLNKADVLGQERRKLTKLFIIYKTIF